MSRDLLDSINEINYLDDHMELSGIDGGSKRLTGVAITSEYFTVLGRSLLLGRAFTDADLRKNIRNVILGARVWAVSSGPGRSMSCRSSGTCWSAT